MNYVVVAKGQLYPIRILISVSDVNSNISNYSWFLQIEFNRKAEIVWKELIPILEKSRESSMNQSADSPNGIPYYNPSKTKDGPSHTAYQDFASMRSEPSNIKFYGEPMNRQMNREATHSDNCADGDLVGV
jgi:hypothetical protein